MYVPSMLESKLVSGVTLFELVALERLNPNHDAWPRDVLDDFSVFSPGFACSFSFSHGSRSLGAPVITSCNQSSSIVAVRSVGADGKPG